MVCVSECDRGTSQRRPRPAKAVEPRGKKDLQDSCRLCDVCTLFVLPVGWVFGLCHLFLVCVSNVSTIGFLVTVWLSFKFRP